MEPKEPKDIQKEMQAITDARKPKPTTTRARKYKLRGYPPSKVDLTVHLVNSIGMLPRYRNR